MEGNDIINMSLREESNDRREFDSTKQSCGERSNCMGLLRRIILLRRMILLAMTICICFVLTEEAAYAQSVDPLISPFHAGLRLDYLRNYNQTNALIVADCPQCGNFSNGSGNGFEVQLFGEIPFNFYRPLDLTFGAGFVQRGGAFGQTVTNSEMVLDNSNTYVPYTRSNSFSASLAYIDLSGGLRITPLKKYPAYFCADLDVDIPAGRSVTYTQTESIISPQGLLYPQNHLTTRTDGAGSVDGANTLFGIRGTLGYELPFGPILTASPELSYYYPLNEVETARPWRVSSVSLGVAFRWNKPPSAVEEPPPPPEKPAKPPIVQHEDPNALAPKLAVASLTSDPLHIIETTVTETFPILPYIFFDSASAVLPDRFAQITPNEASGFKESDLPHRSLESYYQILNVIGSRMTSNPGATLKINGTTDGREGNTDGGSMHDVEKDLAQRRAIAVRDYLANVWKIDATRLIITTTDVPKNPSSTEYAEGFEENRRVELTSDNDQILKPIVHERFREESALPKTIPISLTASSSIGVRNWHLTISSKSNKVYESSGNGEPPKSLEWKPTEGQVESLAKTLGAKDSLTLTLEASATNGAHSSQQVAIPASKSINPFELSRLSLIVFDFDQSSIEEQNKRMISQFVAKSLYPASTATITGSTDNLGELDHNQKLSEARAFNVRDLILADKPTATITSTKGVGPSNLLYDNHLPEGRYYCRTVKVEVETPLESILGGQK
jgi:outer membrane protein OmpA-like peptidoglycan-associated protein